MIIILYITINPSVTFIKLHQYYVFIDEENWALTKIIALKAAKTIIIVWLGQNPATL